MKRFISLILVITTLSLTLLSLFACSTKVGTDPIYVEMSVKDYGKVYICLDPKIAPVTVKNFVKLVDRRFYNGLDFHRVQSGFMIQGGMNEKKELKGIYGEFALNGYENTLSHTRGVISMARTNDPNSATSQFFICNADATFLDGSYAAFGWVVSGMEVIDLITYMTEPYANPFYSNIIEDPENRAVIEYIKVVKESKVPVAQQ